MNKKSLIIQTGTTQPGGMGTVLQTFREYTQQHGPRIRYISIHEGKNKLLDCFLFGKALLLLIWLLLMNRKVIVHSHMTDRGEFFRTLIIQFWVKVVFRQKFVNHLHSGEFVPFVNKLESNPVLRKLFVFFWRHIDIFIVLSNQWHKYITQKAVEYVVPDLPVRILHNPIDLQQVAFERKNTVQERIKLLFLGRVVRVKDPMLLVKIASALKSKGLKFEIQVAGEGDLRAKLEAEVSRNNLEREFKFLGWVSGESKLQVYRECNVFLLTSLHENLPVVVLEAYANSMAVIATRVGGVSDILDDGKNGYMVETGDVQGFVKHILHYANDAVSLQRTGEYNYNDVQKFDVAYTVQKLQDIYKSLG